jgi:hypothetical protein
MRILLVEDEDTIAEPLAAGLRRELAGRRRARAAERDGAQDGCDAERERQREHERDDGDVAAVHGWPPSVDEPKLRPARQGPGQPGVRRSPAAG